jgi:hypothetical protein
MTLHDDPMIDTFASILIERGRTLCHAIQAVTGYEWTISDAAQFEMVVFNLFKLEFALCGRV